MRERARPLAPDDRREMILGAIIPLLKERGREVTSRELAEAAGIAEGTLFRAFGDKESIIRAGVEKMLDPEPFRAALRTIPNDLPLEEKIASILDLLRGRFEGVFAIMAAFGLDGPPPGRAGGFEQWVEIVCDLLEPDARRLAVPAETIAYYVRLVAFASVLPPLNSSRSFDAAELATLVTHGVAVPGVPTPSAPRRATAASARPSAA